MHAVVLLYTLTKVTLRYCPYTYGEFHIFSSLKYPHIYIYINIKYPHIYIYIYIKYPHLSSGFLEDPLLFLFSLTEIE